MAHNYRIGAMAGLLAAASMTVTPAHAAQLPVDTTAKHYTLYTEFHQPLPGDSASEASEYRRWGRWGRRGWRRGHRRGVRAGDVLAGVAIIGGIAAIASAANNNRDRRDRYERRRDRHNDWERENQQDRELRNLREQNREQQRELEYLRSRGVDVETYRGRGAEERLPQQQQRQQVPQDPQEQRRSAAPIGIDGAIDACSNAVSRDAALGDISGVERSGNGWSVRGTVSNGEPFTCRISNDGRIEALDYRDGFRTQAFQNRERAPYDGSYSTRAEGQLSDDRYANARIALVDRGDPREPLNDRFDAAGPQPAYPGGPIPGETIPETVDGDLGNSQGTNWGN